MSLTLLILLLYKELHRHTPPCEDDIRSDFTGLTHLDAMV